jgi:hypothetical protein
VTIGFEAFHLKDAGFVDSSSMMGLSIGGTIFLLGTGSSGTRPHFKGGYHWLSINPVEMESLLGQGLANSKALQA